MKPNVDWILHTLSLCCLGFWRWHRTVQGCPSPRSPSYSRVSKCWIPYHLRRQYTKLLNCPSSRSPCSGVGQFWIPNHLRGQYVYNIAELLFSRKSLLRSKSISNTVPFKGTVDLQYCWTALLPAEVPAQCSRVSQFWILYHFRGEYTILLSCSSPRSPSSRVSKF